MIIIKKKSIFVIFLSSFLITLVLIATLLGTYLHLGIKAEENEAFYYKSLGDSNAQLFSKQILMTSPVLKLGEEGHYEGKPIVEGMITNNSSKKIISFRLRLSILDKDNRVLYIESIYPLHGHGILSPLSDETSSFLSPGNSISYKTILRHCPRHVIKTLQQKTRFAKEKNPETLRLDCKLKDLIVE